jgi:3-oxoacyl-[acyl-carrier-protein] synthase II
MRRVVVTGLGMVSPLGCGVEPTWKRILSSESGAKKIDTFDVSDLTSRIACVVPRGDGTGSTFNPDQWMEPKDQRKVDDFIIFAMCAARQALDDADWHPSSEEDRCATGTMIGSGIGGLSGIADTALLLNERGPRKVSPFFIPGRLINLASGYVSIEHGLKGPNHAVVTADRAWGRGCDGGGRNRIPNLPAVDGGILRIACLVDRLQRHSGKSIAPLRQGSRRLCDGRRRWHRDP